MKIILNVLIALLAVSSLARSQNVLDPVDFISLGTFNPTASVSVDTNGVPTLGVSGGPSFFGVVSFDGRAVFAFDSVDIPAAVTITATGARPFSLLSHSSLILGGTIDVNGQHGFGGFAAGGAGGFGSDQGPGRGFSGGGAGHGGPGGNSGGASPGAGGNPYGGGSFLGGSGGGNDDSPGGGGGGAVELGASCSLMMTATGSVLANGGMPGTPGGLLDESGGGGSGGAILVHAPQVQLSGSLQARGGSAQQADAAGGGGGGGRISIRSLNLGSAGAIQLQGGQGGDGFFPFQGGDSGGQGSLQQNPLSIQDCNQNGASDTCDLLDGTSVDVDGDGVPDECGNGPSFCSGDGGNQAGCTDCPCGNNAVPGTPGGCINESGQSALLLPSGTPSVAGDTLRFEMTGGNPNTFAVLTSGNARAPANAVNPCFGLDSGITAVQLNGLRCVVQGVQRHGARPTDITGSVGMTTNGWGPPNGPPGGLIQQGGFAAGQTRHYQVIYRETPFLTCLQSQNTSQGVTVAFVL